MNSIVKSVSCGVADWWDFAGDPWLTGTIFMASYALTAFLMFCVAGRMVSTQQGYWKLCGWLFMFQLINVNADFHGLFFTIGRCLAHNQGWYEDRHTVQIVALLIMALLAFVIVLIAVYHFRRHIFGNLLLTLGVLTALGLTLVKGVNFHDVDAYIGLKAGPFHGADLIELTGIVMAFVATVWRLARF